MKKIFFCMFVVVTLMLLISTTAFAISGEGTEESPYQITTEQELLLVRDFPNAYFELKNDITATNTKIDLGDFLGVFNGNNHSINLSFYRNNGTIKNVCFKNTEILKDDNYGKLVNCNVCINNRTYESDEIAPLICRNNYGTISKCQGTMSNNIFNVKYFANVTCKYFDKNVYCFAYANEKGAIIEESSFVGKNLSIGEWYHNFEFGAFVRRNLGEIINCYTKCDADISYRKDSDGGFGGYFYGMAYICNGYIENSYVIASVTTDRYESGFENHYYYEDSDSYVKSYGTFVNTYSCINDDYKVNGISKTPLAMTMKATYEGWDFETVWAIDTNINEGYPYLRMGDVVEQVSYPYANIEYGAVKSGTKINISSATEGATIYYTLDGSNPTTQSIRYTEPIIIDKPVTIKVVAVKNGMRDSVIKEFSYTIIPGGYVEPSEPTEPETPTVPEVPPVIPDEDAPIVKVESVKGKSGGTVTVPLYIENNTGIAGMQLSLIYDEGLTLTGMARSTGEEDSALESLNFTVPGDLTATTLTLPWYGLDADSTNGKILVLTFTIPEGAEDDTIYDIAISYEQGGIYDNDLNDVDFEMVNGSITVKNYTIGDINDDGLINTKDITILSRGIAGGYGVTLTEAADVNADGLTNTKDITILSRYIAGGYGVILGK